ncbi:MAG: hypothetical protein AAF432_02385 [Planctomycetota bacterium]
MRRALLVVVPIAWLLCAPGCIVQDIYEQLEMTNASIERVEGQLERVETEMDEIRITNESLARLQTRIERLESIDNSLIKIDEHLASLRKTIANIDSTIPFLQISEDDDPDDAIDESTSIDVEDASPDADQP